MLVKYNLSMSELINFLAYAVNGKKYIPKWDTNYIELYDEAAKHNVQFIIFGAIDKESAPKDVYEQWEKAAASVIVATAYKRRIFEELLKKLDKNNIKAVMVKGFTLSDLYPIPNARVMGDVDLITDIADRDAFNAIMLNSGYAIVTDDEDEVVTFKKQNEYTVEVFKSVNHDIYMGSIPEDSVSYKDFNNIRVLIPSAHIAYIVNHIRKHITFKGAGVRNLSDLYVALTKLDYDKDELLLLVKNNGNEKLFLALTAILDNRFGYNNPFDTSKIEKELPEMLLEFLLRDGAFGNPNVSATTKRGAMKGRSKFGTFLRLVFPPYKEIAARYKFVGKYPILLPVGWLARMFSAIFKRRVKSNVKYLNSNEAKRDKTLFDMLKD